MMSNRLKRHLFLPLIVLFAVSCIDVSLAQQSENGTGAEAVQNIATAAENVFTYSPQGRRDPFKPLIEKQEKIVEKVKSRPEKIKGPLEKFELSQFRLLAIMVVKGVPRAMVKAPDGKSYTVKMNDYIGMNDGLVKKIETKATVIDENGMRIEKNPDRIVVEETGIDSLTGQETTENRYIVM